MRTSLSHTLHSPAPTLTPNHAAILKATEQRFGFLIFQKNQSMLEATVQSIKGLTKYLTKENVNFWLKFW